MDTELLKKLCDKYLDGELSHEEKIEFEKSLLINAELKEYLALHQEVNIRIKQYKQKQDFIRTVKDVESDFFKSEISPIKLRSRNYLLIAASFAGLVVLITALYFLNNQKKQPVEIIAAYYRPIEAITCEREVNIHEQKLLNSCMLLYKNGNYLEAAKCLTSINEELRNSTLYELYLGISLMECSQFDKSIVHLKNAEKDRNSILYSSVQWQLAFYYLKIGDVAAAKLYFEKLSKSRNAYKQRAIEILNQL